MAGVFVENLIEKRGLLFHVIVILLSLAITAGYSLFTHDETVPEGPVSLFILLLIQLEVFFFVAGKVFTGLKPGLTRNEYTKSVLLHFALFISICFLAALIIYIAFIIIQSAMQEEDVAAGVMNFFSYNFKEWLKATLGGLLFGAAIFIFIQWQDALKREQKLREESLIFQNETLKSQVNPHFLFNSLNTVSSLILSNPEKAEEFISNLSSVYRYILENGQKDKVPLQSELDLINRYFDLHRVRDEEKITLSIDYSGADSFQILPVSLQILLENAIKHNIATRENPLHISIYFEGQYIVVKNNLQKKATQMKSTGIGLRNLAERVRLISGKDLVTEETIDCFIVKLPLLK
jgi:sensor histidine kinase YesM